MPYANKRPAAFQRLQVIGNRYRGLGDASDVIDAIGPDFGDGGSTTSWLDFSTGGDGFLQWINPTFPSSSSGGAVTPSAGIDWSSIISNAVKSAGSILTARYAVPPPGTTIQTPQGFIQRVQEGAQQILPSSIGSSSLLTWLMIGGAAVVGIKLISGNR